MKITKLGVQFEYYGDVLTWCWPWRRVHDIVYLSQNRNMDYSSLRQYWQHVGAYEEALRARKLQGFSEKEIVIDWARVKYNHSAVVLLRNININVKTSSFWISIPSKYRPELVKDVVVLFFSDYDKATDTAYSIDAEFAECYLIINGVLEYDNTNRAEFFRESN